MKGGINEKVIEEEENKDGKDKIALCSFAARSLRMTMLNMLFMSNESGRFKALFN